jgi:hypothetical protein
MKKYYRKFFWNDFMDINKLKKFEKLPPDVKRQLAIYMAKWKDKKKQA